MPEQGSISGLVLGAVVFIIIIAFLIAAVVVLSFIKLYIRAPG